MRRGWIVAALMATTAPAAAQTFDSLRATGNEPFWSAEIDADMLVLDRMGMETLTLPVTDSARDGEVRVITAADPDRALRATVRLASGICHDTMTGMPYPLSASVAMGDTVLEGCAGAPEDLLAAQGWRAETLDGADLPEGAEVTLVFDREGRVGGTSGCNRMSGGYTLTGESLTIGPMASTRMACPEPLMQLERSVLGALDTVTGFDIAADGALELRAPDGVVLLARPAPDLA